MSTRDAHALGWARCGQVSRPDPECPGRHSLRAAGVNPCSTRLLILSPVYGTPAAMMRIGLAVLVVLLLAAVRANAGGPVGGGCSPACGPCQICVLNSCSTLPAGLPCGPSAVCDIFGVCVTFTQTPTATSTPTATPTSTPTPTVTPTPHNLPDNESCNDSRQCTSALCNGGVCAERKPAPAVSNHFVLFISAGLLLIGLWSAQRMARRR